jgi:hypothetical protein
MKRATAIALTKKALRITAAESVSPDEFADFEGKKMWVTLQTRGGNRLAHVYGEIKVGSGFEFEVHGSKSSMIKQPYQKPDKAVRKGHGVIMQDGDLKWVIGS